MRDLGITMQKIREAIRASNADVGGRTVELSEFEYVIRGKGYLRDVDDLSKVVLKTSNGTPVLLGDVARVELGPDERRGITELNGEGEVAGDLARVGRRNSPSGAMRDRHIVNSWVAEAKPAPGRETEQKKD